MEEHAGNYVHSGLHRPKSVAFLLITLMVDTTEGKNLFHATAMPVYQRQPTIDDRTYLTKAQHPESHLSSLSMAWLLCMNLVFTKVTLINVKAFQHFLFAQLTANLSATARHIYPLMTTAPIR